ncbi:MAG: DNA polymerase III subunit delta' [Ruminococcus flavefaciens]|nr:DNA polymerase III subunit delta' [Ruminococcus flavefaciens]MCM1228503.1 DNA polymerase III subunit delta' [Ruminococcus flavefaciens]
MKIYGNSYLTDTLGKMIISGKTAHSVIFHGERGTGKKLFADYYTALLLCGNPQNGKPCGNCPSCRNVSAHTHPDVTYVETEGKLGGYSVRTAREIIADAFIKPNNNSGRKIYIFRDCRNMSVQTQNMLLKLIEEPPDYAYFLFTAESKYEFLPTIISRCIALGVSPCTERDSEEYLAEAGYSANEIKTAVSCFHGNIGRCIEYISDEKVRRKIDLTKRIADSIIKGSEYELNVALCSAGSTRGELYDVFSVIDRLVRDSAVLSQDSNAQVIGCFRDTALKLSQVISTGRAVRIHDIIEEAWRAVQANVNATLVLSALCAGIMQVRS